jgi:hemerythrin superfamily protein
MATTRSTSTIKEDIPATGDAIAILMHDHAQVKPLLLQLPDASPATRKGLLDEIVAALTVHNATEENLVYPAIREIAGREQHAGQLYHQQDEAKILIWELSNLLDDDAEFKPKAEKLRDAILAHVHQEEEHEFPHLREAAGTDMNQITAEVRKFRREFRFTPVG